METKRCSKCSKIHPMENYEVGGKVTGHICRDCRNIYFAARYQRKRVEIREKQRAYNSRPEVAAKKKRKKQLRKKDPVGKMREYASMTIATNCQRGNIIKPETCDWCHKKPEAGYIQGHHHLGYERENWKNVLWLCPQCHAQEHKKLREENQNKEELCR